MREASLSKMFRRRTPEERERSDPPLNLSPQFALSFVLKVFEQAKIPEVDQMALLRVPQEALDRCRRGESIIGERELVQRLEGLLQCYTILKILYVREYDSIYAWWTNPNTALPPTPIEHMKRAGIEPVRAYLESALHK
jgi:hypothetical protein